MNIKRKFRGFTLIEMIIVMAILGILMSALMNFYRPIRQTFVDSTMIEDMRNTQNGILTYLSESVRYAENLTFYDEGAVVTIDKDSHATKTVNTPKDAYEVFLYENNLRDDDPAEDAKYEARRRNIQVLVINRSDGYTDTGTHQGVRSTGYGGRLFTNILRDTGTPTAAGFTSASGTSKDTFMALGGAYYGNSDYAIFVDMDKTWSSSGYGSKDDATNITSGGITFAVQTAMTDESGVIKQGSDYGSSVVKVSGGNVFLTTTQTANTMNCESPKYYVAGTDKDLSNEDVRKNNRPAGSLSPTETGITAATKNTYIVILEPDEKR